MLIMHATYIDIYLDYKKKKIQKMCQNATHIQRL